MDGDAYFMRETVSFLGIRGGTGPQCSPGSTTYVKLKLSRNSRETLDAKVRQNFLAAAIFPRKCGRCVKMVRRNFLWEKLSPRQNFRATEFPVTPVSIKAGFV